ncbi:MAG TPA: hypothetical protein VFI70_05610 [Nitrososphaeraceae archaeon]|nr:hypothetical protein [Nitrososphaeraceae archaeon]
MSRDTCAVNFLLSLLLLVSFFPDEPDPLPVDESLPPSPLP